MGDKNRQGVKPASGKLTALASLRPDLRRIENNRERQRMEIRLYHPIPLTFSLQLRSLLLSR